MLSRDTLMSMFSYTVTATFDDPAVADEWVAWLRDEHVRDVIEAGAMDGEVIVVDPDPQERETASGPRRQTCEVRYHFADRAAFEAYVRDHAPRLREEGLKRFPPERGIAYSRHGGEVVSHHD
jgi:hypothetical protein